MQAAREIGLEVLDIFQAHGHADHALRDARGQALRFRQPAVRGAGRVRDGGLGVAQVGSDGADVIFECIGSSATVDQAIACARKGSDIIIVGVVASAGPVNMGFVQDHELRLIGSAMYRVEDYIEAIDLVNAGKIAFEALITHRVKFSDYLSAYKIIEEAKDKAMKVMITFDE